ncbi:MAG: cupin domain-containing protein [bacterium]
MSKDDIGYVVRKVSAVKRERSTCGFRKRLITKDDFAGANFTFLKVFEAEEHYHKKTTEFYYVLNGAGWLELNGKRVEVDPGTLVMIRPRTRHRAEGQVEVLIVGIPPFDPADTFFD